MKNQTIKLLISLFMIVALVIIFISIQTAYRNNQNNEDESEQTATESETADSEYTADTAGSHTDQMTEPEPTTAEILVPLPININEPEPTPAAGLRRWPEDMSIPLIRQPDLQSYIGRQENDRPLDGITVILDPGHGGQDGGAQFPIGVNQPDYIEREIVLEVSLLARDKLEALGARVIMLRETDEWLSIYSRIALVSRFIVNEFIEELPYHGYDHSSISHLLPQLEEMIEINSDFASSGGRGPMLGVGTNADMRLLMDIQNQYPDTLFISVHCNALDDLSVGGLQVFYQTTEAAYQTEHEAVQYQDPMANPPAYSLYPDESRLRLATLIRDEVLANIPTLRFPGEADILQANFAVLREMNMTSILLEMGFITNENDRKILTSPSGQDLIADAIARAVYRYYTQTE